MIPGTQSHVGSADPGTHPRLRLRKTRYLAAFAAIGCKSALAQARKTGLDPKSISNALNGKQIGEVFVARTIAVLSQEEHRRALAEIGLEPTLDAFFEVSTEAANA